MLVASQIDYAGQLLGATLLLADVVPDVLPPTPSESPLLEPRLVGGHRR